LKKERIFTFLKINQNLDMKFFIDTANIDEIKEAHAMGILDGVTTNPSLMAKVGIQGKEAVHNHYKKICEVVSGPVSAEVIATDYEGMVREGEELAKIASNIVVKIPMTADGVKAVKYFSEKGIKTNCTLIFSAGQALIAAKAGATMISPFLGRIDDSSWDGMILIEDIVEVFRNYDFDTEILAASVRNSLHIVKCAQLGADIATCPLSALKGLLYHPLTDLGLAKFIEDSKKFA
jgi:transaldolase